jgi:hypothetical protein
MKDLFDSIFGVVLIPICLGVIGIIFWVLFRNVEISFLPVVSLALLLLPLFLPFVLYYLTFDKWMEFVRTMFSYENGRTTLRIKLPQEVLKSPEAMESVFAQIFNANGSDTLWHAYIDGKCPLISSFEIVSIGGDVRFYANVPKKKIKNALEAQLYAQYPGVEIEEELLDYMAEIKWDPEEMGMMSFHIVKKDDGVLPIKTYIDFGHDRMPKEEEKFEPMAPLLEHMSKAKPHERLYVQILCKPHAKKEFKLGDRKKSGTWEKEANEKINDMLKRDQDKLGPEETVDRPTLTMGERDIVTAIERNIGKYAYEVGIRAMYVTLDKDQFDGEMIGPLLKSFSQYDILNRNGLGVRYKTEIDYAMFKDFSGGKQTNMKKGELEAYKSRSYSPDGEADAAKVLSVEELATIFHIPGSSILTPGLSRIPSTRRTAPNNLPVGNLPI